MNILWQAVGYVAMITIILSFQIKKQNAVIAVQAAAQLLFVIHYTMIGSFSGAVLNFIAVVRALLLLSGNRYLKSDISKYIVMAVFLLSPALVYKSFIDFLPGVAMMINTYCIWSNDGKKLRISQAAVVSPLWIVYNVINNSPPGVLTEIFNMTSSIIFLVRTRSRKEKPIK